MRYQLITIVSIFIFKHSDQPLSNLYIGIIIIYIGISGPSFFVHPNTSFQLKCWKEKGLIDNAVPKGNLFILYMPVHIQQQRKLWRQVPTYK